MLYVVLIIVSVVAVAVIALAPLFLLLFAGEVALNSLPFGRLGRFLLIALKSLRRNLLRTSLTYLASFVLVLVIVMVWSVLYFLGELTRAKEKNLTIIITEKYQMGGLMPFAYAGPLSEGAARSGRPDDVRPQDSMTWQIYVGSLGANKQTREDQVFLIAMEPRKMLTIMDILFDEIRPG
ncbi:MAG TPA: hypothetical protein VKI17_00280, partial [Gemmataceae bacterium]|nr:hypothetical protein [Gemmataceae bacterium]